MSMTRLCPILLLFIFCSAQAQNDEALFQPNDLARVADISEPALTRDGNWLAYVVGTANTEADHSQSDLWRVRYDGSRRTQLTSTADSNEWRPQWSADASSLAFLSDRPRNAEEAKDEATTQVWMMPADGGEARRLTDFRRRRRGLRAVAGRQKVGRDRN